MNAETYGEREEARKYIIHPLREDLAAPGNVIRKCCLDRMVGKMFNILEHLAAGVESWLSKSVNFRIIGSDIQLLSTTSNLPR